VAVADELRMMIDSRAGTWGVYARHLDTGETVAIRADEVMPAQIRYWDRRTSARHRKHCSDGRRFVA
jgi:hypothetical protein